MILFQCRYAPAEIFAAMGAETEYLEPENADPSPAESALHPTVCSFTKAAYDAICGRFESGAAEGVLLTACCDSTRRLYDALRARFPDRFIFIAELPVKADGAARDIYLGGIEALIEAYTAYRGDSGAGFDPARLLAAMRETDEADEEEMDRETLLLGGGRTGKPQIPSSVTDNSVCVGLAGAKAPAAFEAALERAGARVVFNLTCAGQKNRFYKLPPEGASREEVLNAYVRGVFAKYPCMRMVEGIAGPGDNENGHGDRQKHSDGEIIVSGADARRAGLLKAIQETAAEGVVYHTVKFCDQYAYEYAGLRDALEEKRLRLSAVDVPILKLETEYVNADSGALATRAAAFVEQLRARRGSAPSEVPPRAPIVLGVDSGSTTTGVVLFDRAAGRILASAVVPTGPRVTESAEEARRMALARAGLAAAAVAETVATGYGRDSIPFADRTVTEITAHALGARFLRPEVCTVIDIGGQDSKVIRIGGDGKIADFAMNDKCAAGTGRFLEMTARTLGVPLEEIGARALAAREQLTISSMCTVFAESEVISLVAQGKRVEDILWALCRAVAHRNEALLSRVSARSPYLMTGGVANNLGVVRAISERLSAPVEVPPEPEIVGALGAALS